MRVPSRLVWRLRQLYKTLVAKVDGRTLAMGLVPVNRHLNLKALAGALGGKKAEMASPDEAQKTTGYVIGGISPLAPRKRLPVVIDAGILGLERVYVSAGRRGLQIELSPADLIAQTSARTALIAAA